MPQPKSPSPSESHLPLWQPLLLRVRFLRTKKNPYKRSLRMSEPTILSDGKWSCRSCGACCKGFSFGPVEQHIIEGLKEKEISSHWEPAKEEWYVTHPQTGEFYFTHIDGHCIFTRRSDVAIHARWCTCKAVVLQRVSFFGCGTRARNEHYCARRQVAHKSMDDGQPISEQIEEVLILYVPFLVSASHHSRWSFYWGLGCLY